MIRPVLDVPKVSARKDVDVTILHLSSVGFG